MPAGLQVINDNGVVQIDENYRNLVFIQKWIFTTAGDHTFTISGRTAPVLVLYSTSATPIPTAGILLVESSNSGGTWTYRVNGIGEVYLFDVPPAPPAHGFGMQVFNASGQIVFDSSYKPLVVRTYRTWGGPGAIGKDFYTIPQHTLSVAPPSYSWSIVEETSFGSYAPFAKPSAQKWGWIVDGRFGVVCFINKPSAGGPSSSPYGAGDGGVHKGLGALHASGNNFVATFRDIKFSNTYWNGTADWRCAFAFVDLTGL